MSDQIPPIAEGSSSLSAKQKPASELTNGATTSSAMQSSSTNSGDPSAPVASVSINPAKLSDLELRGQLLQHFKHSDFKSKLQRDAIRTVLKRQEDVYISMPTGSGKSLCFQLPGVLQDNRLTIVFSPLLALIKDQIDHLTQLRICAESINSKMTQKERDRVTADLRSVRPSTRFLYITPEQGATESCRQMLRTLLRFDRLAYFAVDEAHCVSEWGHSFRRDYLRLGELREMFPTVPWIALTATASKTVVKDIVRQLCLRAPIKTFKMPCFRKNLFYDVVFKETVPDDFKHLKEFVLRSMGKTDANVKPNKRPCGIIYCRTRETVEQVANGLSKHGVSAQPYHSGLDAKQLKRTQEDWMDGVFPVICATVAFGMGVDKSTVRFVVHWDVPQTVAGYYQESGRAGRDGLPSFCRVYYCRQAVKSISFLLQEDASKAKRYDRGIEQAKRALEDFQQMCTYCETVLCRHRLFSNYFGDEPPKCLAMCDACADRKAADAALLNFQKLSMNFYTGGRISAQDGSDLYGGGREGAKAEAFGGGGGGGGDGGGSSDDEGDSNARAARAAQETTSLIQRQLALRKVAAAKEADMHPSVRLARVKAASSTEVKVSGLTIAVRDSYLGMMADQLKENFLKCGAADVAGQQLVYVDFEDVAQAIEYECFTRNKAAALYRRSCAVESSKIRKATASGEMFEPLKTHVPKKRAIMGGDAQDMQRRLNELEASSGGGAKKPTESRSSGFKKDPMTQTTLGTFFIKKQSTKENGSASPAAVVVANAGPTTPITSVTNAIDSATQAQIAAALAAADQAVADISPDKGVRDAVRPSMDDNETMRREIEANKEEIQRMEAKLQQSKKKSHNDERQSSSSHKDKKSSRHRSRSKERRTHGSKNDKESKRDTDRNESHSRHKDKKSSRRSRSKEKRERSDKPRSEKQPDDKRRNESPPKKRIKSEPGSDAPATSQVHVKQEISATPSTQSGQQQTIIKTERGRSVSPASTVIKDELRRSTSPASTVLKRERADSRERDFDDEPALIERLVQDHQSDQPLIDPSPAVIKGKMRCSVSPASTVLKGERADSRERDFDDADGLIERLVQTEPTKMRRSASPASTVLKGERSNSRERDFDDDDGGMVERLLQSENCRPSSAFSFSSVSSTNTTSVSKPAEASKKRNRSPDSSPKHKSMRHAHSSRREGRNDTNTKSRRVRSRSPTHHRSDERQSTSSSHVSRTHTSRDHRSERKDHHHEQRRPSTKTESRRRSRSPTHRSDERPSTSSQTSKRHSPSRKHRSERHRSPLAPETDDESDLQKRLAEKQLELAAIERAVLAAQSQAGLSDQKPSASVRQISLEDDDDFQKQTAEYVAKRLAKKEKQLEVVNRAVLKTLRQEIAIEKAHEKNLRDEHLSRLLLTDNLEDFDDDEALSNVAVARANRERRNARAAASGRPAPRRSLHEQLYGERDADDAERLDAQEAAVIARETDYKRMDLNGRVEEMELRFQSNMPQVLLERIKREKSRIADIVKKGLNPYYNAGRIQPVSLYRDIACSISHKFHRVPSREGEIEAYVKRIFVRLPCVRSLKDIDESKFL